MTCWRNRAGLKTDELIGNDKITLNQKTTIINIFLMLWSFLSKSPSHHKFSFKLSVKDIFLKHNSMVSEFILEFFNELNLVIDVRIVEERKSYLFNRIIFEEIMGEVFEQFEHVSLVIRADVENSKRSDAFLFLIDTDDSKTQRYVIFNEFKNSKAFIILA